MAATMDKFSFFNRLKAFIKPKEDSDVREAISELIAGDETEEESVLNTEERELFSNVLDLKGLTAEDIMVPRADVVAIPLEATQDECLKIIKESKFSRFPVFHENLDDIRGFIHIKDVLLADGSKGFDLRPHLLRAIYVPTSMPVTDLLTKMRSEKTPLVIVVDEYGGTDGLITSWDILSEILGEMNHGATQDDQARLVHNKDGSYTVDARFNMEELEAACGQTFMTPEMEEEVDTVGGLVMYLAGRVPDRKEIIDHPNGFEFEVVEASPRAIHRIRIHKKDSNTQKA